ncbi:MAG: PDZ domain-containing protein [Spirochaetes bacterium]|nr:PDZ domain-containing protein [Spirochaetota bacterium]
MRFILSAAVLLIPLLISSCFKQEFGGLGIQVPAGTQIVSEENPFVIVSVFEGGTGEDAGLLDGDVIKSVDGRILNGLECDYIVNELIRGKVGETVVLEVQRGEQSFVFNIPRGKIVLQE